MKLLEGQQEEEKKAKEQGEVKVNSSSTRKYLFLAQRIIRDEEKEGLELDVKNKKLRLLIYYTNLSSVLSLE